ncbi:AAA family ATPase [Candidatus Dependentiae bacterium]
MKKIVLTGGPGSGKTSILLALENRAEYVVREAATDWIMYRQACGIVQPWQEEDFQLNIMRLQNLREQRIEDKAARIFLDRSCLDGLAYEDPESTRYKKIAQTAANLHYDLVFLVEPLDFTKKTVVRRESRNEAQQLNDKIESVYRQAGYNPIPVPNGPLEKRVELILTTLGNI